MEEFVLSRRSQKKLLGSLLALIAMIPIITFKIIQFLFLNPIKYIFKAYIFIFVHLFKWIFRVLVLLFKAIGKSVEKLCVARTYLTKNHPYLQAYSLELSDIDGMNGWTFEYYVADLLRKNGYSGVEVTRGSGDFGVDIIAYKNNSLWAFQCKNYSSKLGVSPIQQVYSGAVKYGASISVVITNSYFTDHAKELGNSLGVFLWDRIKLAELIKLSKAELRS